MKSLIVYYSHSGNTEKVAKALKEVMAQKGQADIFRLKPEDESGNFFIQCLRALTGKRAVVRQLPADASEYDIVCIGTPVWAFAPAPAVNAYIDSLNNMSGKEVICFATYGSGAGSDKCLNGMKSALKEKGSSTQYSFKIQQSKVNDEEFIKEAIEKVMRGAV